MKQHSEQTVLVRLDDVKDALKRSLIDDHFIPRIIDSIPQNALGEVLKSSTLRAQLDVAVKALEDISKSRTWGSGSLGYRELVSKVEKFAAQAVATIKQMGGV